MRAIAAAARVLGSGKSSEERNCAKERFQMMTSTAPDAAEVLLAPISVAAGPSVVARTVSLIGTRVGVRKVAVAGVASAAVSEVAELMSNPKQASKRGRRRTIRFTDEGARTPKWVNPARLGHREEK